MTNNQPLTTGITDRNSGAAPTIWARLRLAVVMATILLACFALTGCDDNGVVYTFEGVLGDPPPTFDDDILLGLWRLDKEAVEFQRIGYNHFRLKGNGDSDDDYYDFRIIRIENNLFFDMWQQVKPEIATQPLHFTCKLAVQEKTFTLSCLNTAFLAEHKDEIPLVKIDEFTILTGSPLQLRDLFVKYANDDKAFPVTWTFHRPDLQKVEDLRAAALRGDAAAEEALAKEYQSAENIDEDAGEALRWMSMAAHQGRATAEYELGRMYLKGSGAGVPPQDYSEAMRWLLKASEQGHAGAMYHVGQMHEHGWGVPCDATEAAHWYGKAAELGHAEAHEQLARMLAEGDGVPIDEAAALEHYASAVKLDPSLAISWNGLATLYASAHNPELRSPNKALGAARKAVQLSQRKDPGYLATLAEAYAVSGKPQKAAQVAREALKITAYEPLKLKLEKFVTAAE